MKKTKLQKGSSLYLTVMFMAMILTIAVGVSNLVVSGANLVKGMGDAVRAFHVADSAVEQALHTINSATNQQEIINSGVIIFANDFSDDYKEDVACTIEITRPSDIHINAQGTFNGSSRTEEASF